MKNNNIQNIVGVAIPAVLIIVAFKSIKTITDALGLTESGEEKKASKAVDAADYSNAFKPSYQSEVLSAGKKLTAPALSTSAANAYATAILNAKGYWYDEPEMVASVYRNLKTVFQASQVANAFENYISLAHYGYKVNVLDFLKEFLEDTEIQDYALKYVETYTNY